MHQLSGSDASFFYLETPQAPCHGGPLFIYDPSTAPGGNVTFKQILDRFHRSLPQSRVFRQKLVQVPLNLDHPYWVEDKVFDLEFHVRHIALPRPGDWRQLWIQVARLQSRPLDLSRPPWETYVIEGLDNLAGVTPGCFAIFQKTHHAAIDGQSGMDITTAIHDLTPDAPPPSPDDPWRPEREPQPLELLARAAVHVAANPARFARLVARTTPGLARGLNQIRRREVTMPTVRVPRTRFNQAVDAHRMLEGRRFPLAEVRRIKSTVPGATVNDAVLAIVGGALRQYLSERGELPTASLIASAPISVRSEAERGAAGNQVSAMFVTLGTDVADPVERLKRVRESTHSHKQFSQAIDARSLTEYSEFIPGGLAALAARNASRFQRTALANPMFNTVVTNVPGPQHPLYFCGARMVSYLGTGPLIDGCGLFHPVTSYCGELGICVTSCRSMMADPAHYADCIEASFHQLSAAST